MPCLAISIIPFDKVVPIKIPKAEMIITVLKDAALAPKAEFKKLVASLVTPTDRSNIAKIKRHIKNTRYIVSIK